MFDFVKFTYETTIILFNSLFFLGMSLMSYSSHLFFQTKAVANSITQYKPESMEYAQFICLLVSVVIYLLHLLWKGVSPHIGDAFLEIDFSRVAGGFKKNFLVYALISVCAGPKFSTLYVIILGMYYAVGERKKCVGKFVVVDRIIDKKVVKTININGGYAILVNPKTVGEESLTSNGFIETVQPDYSCILGITTGEGFRIAGQASYVKIKGVDGEYSYWIVTATHCISSFIGNVALRRRGVTFDIPVDSFNRYGDLAVAQAPKDFSSRLGLKAVAAGPLNLKQPLTVFFSLNDKDWKSSCGSIKLDCSVPGKKRARAYDFSTEKGASGAGILQNGMLVMVHGGDFEPFNWGTSLYILVSHLISNRRMKLSALVTKMKDFAGFESSIDSNDYEEDDELVEDWIYKQRGKGNDVSDLWDEAYEMKSFRRIRELEHELQDVLDQGYTKHSSAYRSAITNFKNRKPIPGGESCDLVIKNLPPVVVPAIIEQQPLKAALVIQANPLPREATKQITNVSANVHSVTQQQSGAPQGSGAVEQNQAAKAKRKRKSNSKENGTTPPTPTSQ
nr:hypothetical protein [Sobelivirales sp.]